MAKFNKVLKAIGLGLVKGGVWLAGHPEVLDLVLSLAPKKADTEPSK